MKILQLLCFPLWGSGSGTYVRKLSETLVKEGHEVAIVTPDSREIKGIKIYHVELPFMPVFTGHPEYPKAHLYSQLSGAELNVIQSAFMETTIKAVEEYKPDVIHVHHAANLSWIANYIKAVYQIHYVVTSHNTDIINAVLDKRYIPMTQDALHRADVVVAVSNNTKDRLLKVLARGYKGFYRKTKVVPCGVDIESFSMVGSIEKANKKFSLADEKVVLYSGKITKIKGVDLFIKAAKRVKGAKFVIAGDGEEIGVMKKLASEEKINNIIFTGYLGKESKDLIAQLYRRADCVVVPSTVSEGIPLSALEAMSCGTPVIASDIGGIPTAIKHLQNGILVKPKSVSAIVEAINQIISNPSLAKKLGKKGHQDAREKFAWPRIATKMLKYYKVSYDRSKKNRATKKPSFISEEEYQQQKEILNQ